MQGKCLTIEDAKKLSNYEKLLAENSLLKSNAENIKIVIKKKNKTIEELNKKIKCLEDEIVNLKSNSKQMDIFGG